MQRRRARFQHRNRSLAALLLLAATPLAAQSNDEVQAGTQFNFSTPGARSLGLGGAFIAVADDATAAASNPAGLAQLSAPEASAEGRLWRFTSRFAARGHAPETGVTGLGVDTVGGLVDRQLSERTAGPSFLSYVHTGDRWAVALYRHQLAQYRASVDSQGPFVGSRQNPNRLSPARSSLRLDIASYGLAGAWRPRPSLALGLGLAYLDSNFRARTDRFRRAEPSGDPLADSLTGGFFGPADFLPENVTNTQLQQGDDAALAWTAGMLWRLDSRWSVGAVYRHGPELDFTAVFVDGPASPRPGEVDPDLGGRGRFRIPDVLGAGLAFRPGEAWLLSLDLDHVRYSELARSPVNLLRAAQVERGRFRIDDALEIHLGGEYQGLAARLPWTLRLGCWWEPDHKLRYEGSSDVLQTRFRPGEDEIHAALGAGLVIGRLQLDLAADWSRSVSTVSFSLVRRFTRP